MKSRKLSPTLGAKKTAHKNIKKKISRSLGAGHDPAGRDCSKADSGANFLMWAGAVSTGQVNISNPLSHLVNFDDSGGS